MKRSMNSFIKPMVIAIVAGTVSLYAIQLDPKNPCHQSIQKIDKAYKSNKVFKMLMDQSFEHMVEAPQGYIYGVEIPGWGKAIKTCRLFSKNGVSFCQKH